MRPSTRRWGLPCCCTLTTSRSSACSGSATCAPCSLWAQTSSPTCTLSFDFIACVGKNDAFRAERLLTTILQHTERTHHFRWAYSIGSAHLGLKHTQLDHYMLSSWGSHGEAFEWINKWPHMSCRDPVKPPGQRSPTFLHLASNFKAPGEKGPWMVR